MRTETFHSNYKRSMLATVLSLSALSSVWANDNLRPDPIIAKSATVQLIQSKLTSVNALIAAKFDLTKEQFELTRKGIVVQPDKEKILLRDDGLDGDAERGDGIFSAQVFFDEDALTRQFKLLLDKEAKTRKPTTQLVFDERRLIGRKKIDVASLLEAFQAGKAIPLFPLGGSITVNPDDSLVIRDPGVLQDPVRTFDVCSGVGNPNGVWTFKHLMTEMANTPMTGISPSDFTRMWLSTWETDQNINGWTVANRNINIKSQVIDPWELASGGPSAPLNLDLAPFRALAIVNRVDLRDNTTYGGGSAGEGRFVFEVLGPSCNPLQFTVIFEYGIEKNSCSAVKSWGQQWADLSNFAIGSAAYNAALENITESFVMANASPTKPNGSALNQLRTNEIALGSPWELREFVISDSGWNQHFLMENTVAQTPDLSLNNTNTVRDFVLSGAPVVPLRFPTIADPFRGGSSLTPFAMFWDHPGILPRQKRHDFSLNTCNGCHAGETNTFFTHIKPATGIPAALSGFMTGISVTDPADSAPTRTFNEFARRKTDLENLVNSSCIQFLSTNVLRAVH